MTPEEAFAEFVEQREVFTLLAPFWNGNYEITMQKGATLFGSASDKERFMIHIVRKGDTVPLGGDGSGYSILDAARAAVKNYNEALKQAQLEIAKKHKMMQEAERAKRMEALDNARMNGPSLLKNFPIQSPHGKR